MKKYFVISDIHGFYSSMKKSLFKAGFRKTNSNHVLIICGDLFDRGKESKKIFDFYLISFLTNFIILCESPSKSVHS